MRLDLTLTNHTHTADFNLIIHGLFFDNNILDSFKWLTKGVQLMFLWINNGKCHKLDRNKNENNSTDWL